MAVTEVRATIRNNTIDLEKTDKGSYEGSVNAPENPGDYSVKILASDDAGNVAVAESALNVMLWHTPKTDWKETDRFNISDFNRIKNNLIYLHELSEELQRNYSMPDMGDDITDYKPYWDVKKFNLFETNLDLINDHIFTVDYGMGQTFYENGIFIKWDELNRIESAILSMNEIMQKQKSGLRKIGFRLGSYKEVRI